MIPLLQNPTSVSAAFNCLFFVTLDLLASRLNLFCFVLFVIELLLNISSMGNAPLQVRSVKLWIQLSFHYHCTTVSCFKYQNQNVNFK